MTASEVQVGQMLDVAGWVLPQWQLRRRPAQVSQIDRGRILRDGLLAESVTRFHLADGRTTKCYRNDEKVRTA